MADQILDSLNVVLDEDFDLVEQKTQKTNARDGLQSRKQFVDHLVSVATHSIGLEASMKPFNCSREQMLAYLREMSGMTEQQLEKVLQEHDDRGANLTPRNCWEPELRIRLNPPSFFYDKDRHLKDLRVRLFEDNLVTRSRLTGDSSERILENFKIRQSTDISAAAARPHDTIRCSIKFVKATNDEDSYKMKHTNNNNDQAEKSNTNSNGRFVDGDIYLKIRGRSCKPDSVHILRFEFWLNNNSTNPMRRGLIRLRQLARCLDSLKCCKSKMGPASGLQDFYGYTNIRLSQIPAYAMNGTHSIVSSNDFPRINSCEICLEFRNKQLKPDGSSAGESDRLINHMRLVADCLLYQIDQSLPSTDNWASNGFNLKMSLSLDNLLYLPAYSLINQHRLQNNLTQLENQSLQRTSMLILLLEVGRRQRDQANNKRLMIHLAILISLIQSEYLVAHRSVDDKTLQDIDPFRKIQLEDSTRLVIVNLEALAINRLVDKFLAYRLERWLVRPSQISKSDLNIEQDRQLTLNCLRLCRVIICHLKTSKVVNGKLKLMATNVEVKIQRIIAGVMQQNWTERLSRITTVAGSPSPVGVRGKLRGREGKFGKGKKSISNPWRRLLHDIRSTNRDLCLYWSKDGSKSINFSKSPKIEEKDGNLWTTIEGKLNQFIKI